VPLSSVVFIVKLVPNISAFPSLQIAIPAKLPGDGQVIFNSTPDPPAEFTINVYLKPLVRAGNVYSAS
jgi:hypothetical protein